MVILMDRTIPPQEPTLFARRIATAAVDALGPHDLAAVVSTSNGTVQNLTSDRTRLVRAINAGDPSTDVTEEAKGIFAAMGVPLDTLSDGRCLCGLCVHETITRVADAVRSTPRRRKLLLFIGSSIIWQAMRPAAEAGQVVGCESRIEDARNAMFAAIDRANLTVHSIDPRGLMNVGPQTKAFVGGGGPAGSSARLRQQQMDTTNVMTSQQSLQVLPERTGGRTVLNANKPEEIVPAIYRESDSYYVLGVERGAASRSDAPRSLEVKVARKGVRVYAQRKYVPSLSSNGPSRSPAEALNRLLPSGSVPLVLSVTPIANGDGRKALVRVNMDVRAFAHGDGTSAPLDVAMLAVDPTGKPLASARQTSTISAAPANGATPEELNVQSHLELEPGEYGIRIAVSDQVRGALASVFSDVTVPEFDKEPLSVSGVAVDIARTPSASPVPTTQRTFRRTDRVRALVQIYQGHPADRCDRARVDARADPRRQRQRGTRSVAAVRRAGVLEPPRGVRRDDSDRQPPARRVRAEARSVDGSPDRRPRAALHRRVVDDRHEWRRVHGSG